MSEDREPVYCDCHGTEKMAERVGNKIIIQRLRKKKLHIVIIDIDKETNDIDNSK